MPPAPKPPTLAELKHELRRPFTVDAVKWKLQTNPNTKGNAMVVAYIDARLVAERLNALLGDRWSDEYLPIVHSADDSKLAVRCRITLHGPPDLSVEDVGTFPHGTDDVRIKGGYSDAFKRAAVKLGVGVSLYSIPTQWLNLQKGDLRQVGRTIVIEPQGRHKLRSAYMAWLDATGKAAFGEPLGHGETPDEQGDVEVAVTSPPEAPAAEEAVNPEQLKFYADLLKGLSFEPMDIKRHLTATYGKSRMRELSAEQLSDFGSWIESQIEDSK